MDCHEAMRQEAERLKRSIRFLLAFANIAERTACLPAPVRFTMLVILRIALGAGQRLVSGLADDFGLDLVLPETDPGADSIDELFDLARTFRILGLLLGDLAAWSGNFGDNADDNSRDLSSNCLDPAVFAAVIILVTVCAAHAIRAGPAPFHRCSGV